MASGTETSSTTSGMALTLARKLDTSAAERLHADLQAHIGSDVVLDGSAVEMLGGRCTDILMSARSLWDASDRTFAIASPSDAFLRDLAVFGIAPDALAVGDLS